MMSLKKLGPSGPLVQWLFLSLVYLTSSAISDPLGDGNLSSSFSDRGGFEVGNGSSSYGTGQALNVLGNIKSQGEAAEPSNPPKDLLFNSKRLYRFTMIPSAVDLRDYLDFAEYECPTKWDDIRYWRYEGVQCEIPKEKSRTLVEVILFAESNSLTAERRKPNADNFSMTELAVAPRFWPK